jgi:hypothetical protein
MTQGPNSVIPKFHNLKFSNPQSETGNPPEGWESHEQTGNPPEGWESEGQTGNPPEGWESEGQIPVFFNLDLLP